VRYCDEEAITFDLAISGEKREMKETIAEKRRRLKDILKSSARICLHRKSREWKESNESRKSE